MRSVCGAYKGYDFTLHFSKTTEGDISFQTTQPLQKTQTLQTTRRVESVQRCKRRESKNTHSIFCKKFCKRHQVSSVLHKRRRARFGPLLCKIRHTKHTLQRRFLIYYMVISIHLYGQNRIITIKRL